MRTRSLRAAAAVCAAVLLGGAPAEARGPYSRRTPIVEAVEKTKKGVVTLKVLKRADGGRKEVVGTGVIVDERGYVVTNHHVVAGAVTVRVELHDRTALTATVHASDLKHDLAILKVTAKGKLQALRFGPGSDLMVGETVIAVGHPFGYTNTVSTGIISALGRKVTMNGEVLTGLIQTNASINPGNSGGPLLNINGELVGVNVALREGAQNIAFALNADTVQAVLSDHLSALKVAKLRHGLACGEVVGAVEGAARQKVVVEGVAAKSPAADAGLKKGDVILAVAGLSVQNRFDVERALWGHKAGDKVEATIVRAGKTTKVALTLADGAKGGR